MDVFVSLFVRVCIDNDDSRQSPVPGCQWSSTGNWNWHWQLATAPASGWQLCPSPGPPEQQGHRPHRTDVFGLLGNGKRWNPPTCISAGTSGVLAVRLDYDQRSGQTAHGLAAVRDGGLFVRETSSNERTYSDSSLRFVPHHLSVHFAGLGAGDSHSEEGRGNAAAEALRAAGRPGRQGRGLGADAAGARRQDARHGEAHAAGLRHRSRLRRRPHGHHRRQARRARPRHRVQPRHGRAVEEQRRRPPASPTRPRS